MTDLYYRFSSHFPPKISLMLFLAVGVVGIGQPNFLLADGFGSSEKPRVESTFSSPYRYTINGWENSADWHIETKRAEPMSIWVSIHPVVWSSGLLLAALMILIGTARDEEFDLVVLSKSKSLITLQLIANGGPALADQQKISMKNGK